MRDLIYNGCITFIKISASFLQQIYILYIIKNGGVT